MFSSPALHIWRGGSPILFKRGLTECSRRSAGSPLWSQKKKHSHANRKGTLFTSLPIPFMWDLLTLPHIPWISPSISKNSSALRKGEKILGNHQNTTVKDARLCLLVVTEACLCLLFAAKPSSTKSRPLLYLKTIMGPMKIKLVLAFCLLPTFCQQNQRSLLP